MKIIKLLSLVLFCHMQAWAVNPLIINIESRKYTSLNGEWQYIIDVFETGYYNYKYIKRNDKDKQAFWNNGIPADKTERIEHGYVDKYVLKVPGDWNSQNPRLDLYEGTVWYKKSFDYIKSDKNNKLFVHFGAVNYKANVFINGKYLGEHKGGFTPFCFEIPDSSLLEKDNYLIVKADNKRYADEIPALNFDWWNYGGITRDVHLVELPAVHIINYQFAMQKDKTITCKINMSQYVENEMVKIEIPALKFVKIIKAKEAQNLSLKVPGITLWSPESPKLYQIIITTSTEKIADKIGFKTIETRQTELLLNGKPLFMKGICIHEELPTQGRRAYTKQDAVILLNWAKDLGCNMVRLAHYPHNEHMTKVADSLGLIVWSEIPVYWNINFNNAETLEKANTQLAEMVTRDINRACVAIWSVGNETPVSEQRTKFMAELIKSTKILDPSRLVSAALEVHYNVPDWDTHIVNDPLGEYVDIVSINEYNGWYGGLPTNCRTIKWDIKYKKPFFISETGAEALGGFYADSLTRWSEEYQEWYYTEQTEMMRKIGKQFVGCSPWILADFRSPKRLNPYYQEGWNNKGLVGHKGNKKKAFYVLKKYYEEIK
ncbi:MAG: glycoside hydrolase family 2 TIM barrel-domain containing protein [Cytophagales bacterium]|nr:glycoside hydrolase family 2 TIM barrel-domain containing protein [Cytophagales bacterium]